MIKSVNNQDFKIIAVSNRKLCNRPFLEQIERVCKIHPEAVILREKDLTEEEYGTLAKEVMNICRRYQVSCILHNFWKTALELGCTSVHLPLPILQKIADEEKKKLESNKADTIIDKAKKEAEKIKRDSLFETKEEIHKLKLEADKEIKEKKKFTKIGISIHSVEEAKEAEQLGASYLTAGHIYATDCKRGLPPRGLGFLKEVCREVSIPVYGIGGIKFDEEQWNDMKKCGAVGGCVMSGMMEI